MFKIIIWGTRATASLLRTKTKRTAKISKSQSYLKPILIWALMSPSCNPCHHNHINRTFNSRISTYNNSSNLYHSKTQPRIRSNSPLSQLSRWQHHRRLRPTSTSQCTTHPKLQVVMLMVFLTRWSKNTLRSPLITTLLLHLLREEVLRGAAVRWRTSNNKSRNRNHKHLNHSNMFKTTYNKVSRFPRYAQVYPVITIAILVVVVVAAGLHLPTTWKNSKLCYRSMLVNCSTKMRRWRNRRPHSWPYNIWWSDIIIRRRLASRPTITFMVQTLIHTTTWPLRS